MSHQYDGDKPVTCPECEGSAIDRCELRPLGYLA